MVTFNWFLRMQENGVALSDDLVIASAKRFYALLPRDENEKELQFLNGLIQKFKRRFQIKGYVWHGEDASADTSPEALQQMENIKAIVSTYDIADVFNMDETGLFYRLEPNRTLATKRVFG